MFICHFPSVVGRGLPLRSTEVPHTATVSPRAMKCGNQPASTEGPDLQGRGQGPVVSAMAARVSAWLSVRTVAPSS